MNHLQKLTSQFRVHVFIVLLFDNLIVLADWWVAEHVLKLNGYELIAAVGVVSVFTLTFLPWVSARYLTQPTRIIWQAILHIAPDTANTPAPDLKHNHLGKDLITSLVTHIYQLASVAESVDRLSSRKHIELQTDFVANSLPLPLMILDKDNNVLFANSNMLKYIQRDADATIGQNVYSVLDMSFTNEHTFDAWLNQARANKPVDTATWERVRLTPPDSKTTLQFDLAAYYNRGNPQGYQTMLVFFDHTDQYSQDDQAIGFVALAVHELRTPLTLLRGYVEAFEEELSGKLDPELAGFMSKMSAASQQLAAFVNNILNVARIENDQLELRLSEQNWPDIVQSAVNDMSLRAQVRGIALETDIAKDLPPVGVDRVSIYEVITNLIDNAIKYSADSNRIVISTQLTHDGDVETTVRDFGVGVPTAAVGNLFDKFYRNHRNRSQIGGTGLGLYLSKAIVSAHGGQIWVKSKEGEGSTFGFTVLPYAKLAAEQKTGDNNSGIVHSAHGWIKNHSMYRR
ncbi:MAG TPA: ATP-binding protein [Candidatus Saccharimonadales bacterium]|nr:ATP-binding protein [Candidatus Saccharimonadales bacterium]